MCRSDTSPQDCNARARQRNFYTQIQENIQPSMKKLAFIDYLIISYPIPYPQRESNIRGIPISHPVHPSNSKIISTSCPESSSQTPLKPVNIFKKPLNKHRQLSSLIIWFSRHVHNRGWSIINRVWQRRSWSHRYRRLLALDRGFGR